uniref:Ig-like domain-containing protein n=1 Tax=Sphenodon punctatus TaxID=8508 RepID=A0A8D0GMZ3_SPHPU
MGEMREMMDTLLCLWAAAFFGVTQACPEPCSCAGKKYGRQLAECAYKDLQAVPVGLPGNVTTLTLSANRINSLQEDSFAEVTQLQSLWLAHNEISTIGKGTFSRLVQLKNIDLSHNWIMDFPWGDLYNLTALQMLKLNNNRLLKLPWEAFRTLRDLRSLWINDNNMAAISERTFDSTSSLSQLQIHNNPFNCSCRILWLKKWLENTSVSIPERDSITCAAPYHLKGVSLGKIPLLNCALPSLQLTYQSNLDNTVLHDGLTFMLHCSITGTPQPEVRWKIRTSSQGVEINGPNVEKDGNDLPAESFKQNKEQFLVFKNGSLAIPKFSKQYEGTYTCQAVNEVGTREVSVNVALASSENPAEDILRNNIQAGKVGEDPSKAEEKIVIIYHTPTMPKTNSGGNQRDPQLWACLLLFGLRPLFAF